MLIEFRFFYVSPARYANLEAMKRWAKTHSSTQPLMIECVDLGAKMSKDLVFKLDFPGGNGKKMPLQLSVDGLKSLWLSY
jgi:hypothetical protein